MIVATDTRGVIGQENKIPWHLRSDLVRLATWCRNHTVIVGRKSYESMQWYYQRSGKNMPGAHYIVLTRDTVYKAPATNVLPAHSVAEALTKSKELGDETILVIGGGSMYKAFLPHADRIYLTEVKTTVGEGDARFPALNPQQWHEIAREHFEASATDDFASDLITFKRHS